VRNAIPPIKQAEDEILQTFTVNRHGAAEQDWQFSSQPIGQAERKFECIARIPNFSFQELWMSLFLK
jgi:hypothetical protein